MAAGSFETEPLMADLRGLLRLEKGRGLQPTAVIVASRTLQMQSTPESGAARRGTGRGGAGYDGHQRRTGSKVHAAVETVGWAISWRCTARPAAGPMNRTAPLAAQLQDVPGEHVELASGDQGYPGEQPALEAAAHGLPLEVVTLPAGAGPTRGCVLLLPRHAAALGGGGGGRARRRWATRFRCLAHDDERLPAVLAGLHFVVFACLMLTQFTQLVHLLSSP